MAHRLLNHQSNQATEERRNTMSKKLIIITAFALVGFGSFAFAHWSGGYGQHGWMHGGYGMHQHYYGDRGYGYRGNLSEDQIKALDNEQDAFLKQTETIRQDLYTRQLSLENELAKTNPDTAKAEALQKGISRLEAQLDQMRIDHVIKMKKIDPDAGGGFTAMGPRMGYGGHYPGSCWQ
jgi:Spy/CpxP family protein refolding chaperone